MREHKILISESYLLFDISSLKIGDTIYTDIFIKQDNKYIIKIKNDTTITKEIYTALQKEENLYILNQHEESIHVKKENTHSSGEIDCKLLLESVKENKHDLHKTLNFLYDASNQVFNNFLNSDKDKIDLFSKDSIIKSAIFLVQNNKNYLQQIMPKLSNDYRLYSHSVNVMIYAIHIGNLLKYGYGRLLKLAEAALLHDIGEKKINYILDKSGKLDKKELELIKKHTEYASEILKTNKINDPIIISAIEQHHERYDGSGYQKHLKSYEISEFASIISICDVFDALTIDRPHRKKYTTFESLKLMMQDPSMKNKFNNDYIKLLLK